MDGGAAQNIPTIVTIFGATGDLTHRKVVPALWHLFEQNELPEQFAVIGVSRRDTDDARWRESLGEMVRKHLGLADPLTDDFTNLFSFQQGYFDSDDTYEAIARRIQEIDDDWGVCTNKIFYLAVSPAHYKTILQQLAGSGLTDACGGPDGWTRVVVEKPFGKNLDEAKKLDQLLDDRFKEEQIYRVDHYLAKEVLRNILLFRFANNLLEGVWSNRHIEKIEVKLLEEIGVEGRGEFYDGIGALLDVGQNHLLQMAALVTMTDPRSLASENIREQRLAVLEKLRPIQEDEVISRAVRGQYEGFNEETGVDPASSTETYFKIKTEIDSDRWRGVPIYLESGKKMSAAQKEIIITFKHPAPCLCPPGDHYRNSIHFRLEPEPGITIQFWSKKPGPGMNLERRVLDFKYGEEMEAHTYLEGYPNLILSFIAGDQTLFISSAETAAGWRFIDPIIKGWQESAAPLHIYGGDSDLEKTADSILAGGSAREATVQEVAVVGLGKMGGGIAEQLLEKDWRVVGYNRHERATQALEEKGLSGAYSLAEVVSKLSRPRVVWVMVPAGKPVDDMLFGPDGLAAGLDEGDIIVDGGNSFYKDSIRRAADLERHGLKFMDVGVSGGPEGARHGASLMIGGDRETFEYLQPLFQDIAAPGAAAFFKGAGAGHFVKMVHNGIEYGMMQSIAEGFGIMKQSGFDLDLAEVADVYNHSSVIESRLMGWLRDAFVSFGEDLEPLSGSVSHTGEAESTVKTAKELNVDDRVIADSLAFRVESESRASYIGKILTALRGQFGGHAIRNDDEGKIRKTS